MIFNFYGITSSCQALSAAPDLIGYQVETGDQNPIVAPKVTFFIVG